MEFAYNKFQELMGDLYFRALTVFPPDLKDALNKSYERERNEVAKEMLGVMLKSIKSGEEKKIPVCQDMGMQTYFVHLGSKMKVDGFKLKEAVREGVRDCSNGKQYRKTLSNPITRFKDGQQVSNTHPHIYWDWIPDVDYMEVMCVSKGSGSENQSFQAMCVPAQGMHGVKEFIIDSALAAGGQPCTPSVTCVGIGGSFDQNAKMTKICMTRPVGKPNPDPLIAKLEQEIYQVINATNIGPMGMGGDTTTLAVHIETAGVHETQNPVSVSFQCWAARRAAARIFSDGRFEYIWEFGGDRYE
ncbi:MAG: fumarate hydratase [Thermodesulfobacteriota bacterium]|nr:fumarate hydratase [Thermodesulfobacteriota bacterium]